MPKNRIFERPECWRRSLSASLTDVTKTARQWDAVFAMRVHPELLGKYTAPNMADDDEGYYLVGALVQEIDAALDGRMPSRLVSYGKFLALDFTFLARRRRTSSEEVLNLRAVLGPCDGSHPFLCVVAKSVKSSETSRERGYDSGQSQQARAAHPGGHDGTVVDGPGLLRQRARPGRGAPVAHNEAKRNDPPPPLISSSREGFGVTPGLRGLQSLCHAGVMLIYLDNLLIICR